MRIVGRIKCVDLNARTIGLLSAKRIKYFYFNSSQLNTFRHYLYVGTYIDLEYDENLNFTKNGKVSYFINYINQVFKALRVGRLLYYDRYSLNSSLLSFLNSLGNMMFLDLEMTMPSYGTHGDFKAEIIQVGYLLVDNNGDEITRYNSYIKPTIQKNLSKRTLDFLKIDNADFVSRAISYQEFYADFNSVYRLYHPTIIIFGKNDIITLEKSYGINNLPSIKDVRYVNLCRLIKNYYNLKNEPGLFKLYQTYYQKNDLQIHDAFNDCFVTREVFKAFKADVNHETNNYNLIRNTLEKKA